jgi:hypothetical protein
MNAVYHTISVKPTAPGPFSVKNPLAGGTAPNCAVIQMTSGGAIWFGSPKYGLNTINLVASEYAVTADLVIW